MAPINLPPSNNLNNLMYWLEIYNRQSNPREYLHNELFFNSQDIDVTLRYEAGKLLGELLWKRNIVGAEWERKGFLGLAILAYEKNVKDCFRGDFPYERLRILYSRLGLYEEAVKSCMSFLALPNHPLGYDEKKRMKFHQHIEKISIRLSKQKPNSLSKPLVLLDTFIECDIPEINLSGTMIPSSHGKAKYKLQNGKEGAIENFVLEYFLQNGYSGFWSENDYWWMILSLLFWDIIFYPIPGMFYEDENFPKQDMPMDLFDIDFYIRREDIIQKLISEIRKISKSEMSELSGIMESSYKKNKYKPCRPINDWNKFSLSDLQKAMEILSPNQIVTSMERLLFYYGEYRRGLPDLFLIKDNKPLFIECKEKKEKVTEYQYSWHKYLISEANIPVKVCRVENI